MPEETEKRTRIIKRIVQSVSFFFNFAELRKKIKNCIEYVIGIKFIDKFRIQINYGICILTKNQEDFIYFLYR